MTLFSVGGYVRFHRSLLRFYRDMSGKDAAELTYTLYAANIESYRHHRPGAVVAELSKEDFYNRLDKGKRKPYRTVVQLYRAMEALMYSIDYKIISMERLSAYNNMLSLMDDTEDRFSKAFYMAINDRRTIYAMCKRSLSPYKNEPGLCLTQDLAAP